MARHWTWIGLGLAIALSACEKPPAPPPDIRPVRSVTVEKHASGQTLQLTGQIRAQDEVNLAFRLDGRMIEREVNVGDKVTPGEVVARLDAQPMQNALRSAEAAFSAAQGQLTQAKNTFDRQQSLLTQGFTTRAQYDQAQQALQSAQSQVDNTQAQLNSARDQLGYTELSADAGDGERNHEIDDQRLVPERPQREVEPVHGAPPMSRTFCPGRSVCTPAVTTISPGCRPPATVTVAGS